MQQRQCRAVQGIGFGLWLARQQFHLRGDGRRTGAAHARLDTGLAGGGSEGGNAFLVQDGEGVFLMRPVRA
ncbi:hypothetical protein D3C77_663290 [compost metagenome]